MKKILGINVRCKADKTSKVNYKKILTAIPNQLKYLDEQNHDTYPLVYKYMSDLLNKKCVPCEEGILPFDISEIHKYQKKVDGWEVKKNEKKIYFLEKKFTFKAFINSQNFINKVGKISEEEGHHPDISFGWGYAKIIITTHAIEGLSENDFILAAKIDQIN